MADPKAVTEAAKAGGVSENVLCAELSEFRLEMNRRLDGIEASLEEIKLLLAQDKTRSGDEKRSLEGLVKSVERTPQMWEAVTQVLQGDGAGALASIAAASGAVRESAEALYARAAALEAQGNWAEAVEAYKQTVAKDPQMSNAWFSLGLAEYNKNGKKSTEASFGPYTRCLELDPTHARAHSNLGILLETGHKDYDGAEAEYRKAIELDPTDTRWHNNLGTLLKTVRKDYDGAEAEYRKAIELDPTNAHAHFNLGDLLKEVRKYGDAEAEYRKAIELDPTNARGDYNFGWLPGQQVQIVGGKYKGRGSGIVVRTTPKMIVLTLDDGKEVRIDKFSVSCAQQFWHAA